MSIFGQISCKNSRYTKTFFSKKRNECFSDALFSIPPCPSVVFPLHRVYLHMIKPLVMPDHTSKDEQIPRSVISCKECVSRGNWVLLNPQTPRSNLFIMGGVSEDSLSTILSFLDGQSLIAVGNVCTQLRFLSNENSFWLNICRVEYGISPEQLSRTKMTDGKMLYQFAFENMRR
jgi:hypothetical protein